jgi:hypothetical protein
MHVRTSLPHHLEWPIPLCQPANQSHHIIRQAGTRLARWLGFRVSFLCPVQFFPAHYGAAQNILKRWTHFFPGTLFVLWKRTTMNKHSGCVDHVGDSSGVAGWSWSLGKWDECVFRGKRASLKELSWLNWLTKKQFWIFLGEVGKFYATDCVSENEIQTHFPANRLYK